MNAEENMVPARSRLILTAFLLLLTTSAVFAQSLTKDDVIRIVAQAVAQAQATGLAARVAVVDKDGNTLAIFRMTGSKDNITIVPDHGLVALACKPDGTVAPPVPTST